MVVFTSMSALQAGPIHCSQLQSSVQYEAESPEGGGLQHHKSCRALQLAGDEGRLSPSGTVCERGLGSGAMCCRNSPSYCRLLACGEGATWGPCLLLVNLKGCRMPTPQWAERTHCPTLRLGHPVRNRYTHCPTASLLSQ